MTHDGLEPGAHAGSLLEEVPEAQGFLACVLHQVLSLLPIVGELIGIATEKWEQSDQLGFKGCPWPPISNFDQRSRGTLALNSRLLPSVIKNQVGHEDPSFLLRARNLNRTK
jgi:hypothetical protein